MTSLYPQPQLTNQWTSKFHDATSTWTRNALEKSSFLSLGPSTTRTSRYEQTLMFWLHGLTQVKFMALTRKPPIVWDNSRTENLKLQKEIFCQEIKLEDSSLAISESTKTSLWLFSRLFSWDNTIESAISSFKRTQISVTKKFSISLVTTSSVWFNTSPTMNIFLLYSESNSLKNSSVNTTTILQQTLTFTQNFQLPLSG